MGRFRAVALSESQGATGEEVIVIGPQFVESLVLILVTGFDLLQVPFLMKNELN